MAKSSTTFKKGEAVRPPGAGRKKGVPNKIGPTTMDLIETLKSKGHNAAAAQVEIYALAIKRYKFKVAGKSDWGAATYLSIAEKANSELMKYCYAQRKAIEGANGEALTFSQMIKIISGENDTDE